MAVTLTNLCQDRDRSQLVHLVNFKSLNMYHKYEWKEKMMILVSQERIHEVAGVLATVEAVYLIKVYSKRDVF